MTTANKLTVLLFLFLTFSLSSPAQTVKVKKDDTRVKGENLSGFVVELDGSDNDVNSSLLKYFKAMGKTRQYDGVISLMDTKAHGSGEKNPIYGVVKGDSKSARAWFGINKSEWSNADLDKELEKLAYEFGVKFYKDKIQIQIDESVRAFQAVEKQQQKLVTQNRDLNMRLEDNKREKIQLEQALQNNALQYQVLLVKIDQNKHDQDSMVVVNEQVKKVVEANKEKQRKVN